MENNQSALTTLLNNIGNEILDIKTASGWKITGPDDWEDQHEVPTELMLIVTEVSEAMEAFRHDDKTNFAEELADVMIRTIGLSRGLGIDLGNFIESKIRKNRSRTYKHGGKRV